MRVEKKVLNDAISCRKFQAGNHYEIQSQTVEEAQNPHAHRCALSNQMFRLHGISCLTRLAP